MNGAIPEIKKEWEEEFAPPKKPKDVYFFNVEKNRIDTVPMVGWVREGGKLIGELSPVFGLKVYSWLDESGEPIGKSVEIMAGKTGKREGWVNLKEDDVIRIRTYGPTAFSERDGLYILNSDTRKLRCKLFQMEERRELVCDLMEG